jgi:hypothetical protein
MPSTHSSHFESVETAEGYSDQFWLMSDHLVKCIFFIRCTVSKIMTEKYETGTLVCLFIIYRVTGR